MKHDDWNRRYVGYIMNLKCNMKWFMNGFGNFWKLAYIVSQFGLSV